MMGLIRLLAQRRVMGDEVLPLTEGADFTRFGLKQLLVLQAPQ